MELEINKRIPKQVERLLRQMLPKDTAQNYMPYFMRLISSNTSKPSNPENIIVQKILSSIDVNKTDRFKELYIRLSKFKSINTRKELLQLLFSVRGAENVSFLPLDIGKTGVRPLRIQAYPVPPLYQSTISKLEKELLCDLLFILEGAEGKYLKFSNLEEKFVVQSSYTLTSVTKILEEISEAAFLFKNLSSYLQSSQVALANDALAGCIRDELCEYYRLIALIKQEKLANLKKVHHWLHDPIQIIKWMSILVEACETLRGSDIVSAVFSYSCQGNLTVKNLMIKILEKVSSPLMNMIEAWISEGDLNDPSQEFFISKDDLIPESEMWTSKFFLKTQHVPCFFTQKLVSEIFSSGKCINFLKTCCNKNHQILKLKPKPLISQIPSMQDWVGQAFQVMNEEVVKVLKEDFKLFSHFSFIRKFMLMGKGDFHHSLMEQLVEVLDEKPGKIFKHNLRTIMENAIRSSNFQYEDQEFLNRFDIGFLDAQPLDVGWDVFFLEYVIDPPISTVVTLWCSECYLKVFRFLFAVKRAEFILNQYQNNRLFLTSSDENFSLCMRVTCCLRASLRHFINILWAYLMIEGVESSWKEFEAKVWNLKNLDEILKVHYLFVEKLTLKCLINHKDVVAVIRKVIHMTVKSQEIFKSLSDLLLSEVLMSEKVQNMIKGIFQQVQDLQKSFNSEVVSLLMLFETSGIPELKLLASKLNFNDIYNN